MASDEGTVSVVRPSERDAATQCLKNLARFPSDVLSRQVLAGLEPNEVEVLHEAFASTSTSATRREQPQQQQQRPPPPPPHSAWASSTSPSDGGESIGHSDANTTSGHDRVEGRPASGGGASGGGCTAGAASAESSSSLPPIPKAGGGGGRREKTPRAAAQDTRSDSSKNTFGSAGVALSRTERAKMAAAARADVVVPSSSYDADERYRPGILELERRLVGLRLLYSKWDAADSGGGETGADEAVGVPGVPTAELDAVLRCYYGCEEGGGGGGELQKMPERLAKGVLQETMEWEEFCEYGRFARLNGHTQRPNADRYMHTLTATVNPRGFDALVEFLLRCNGDVSKGVCTIFHVP